MAIYHMQVRVVSRGHRARATASAAYQSARPVRGRRVSVVQSAAYQSGESLRAEAESRTWRYGRAERVQAEGVVLPDVLSPEARVWYGNRENLWNAVEAAETLENAQLARRIIVALPRELDNEARQDLVQTFARDLVSHGMAVDWAIHGDHDGPDGSCNNPHAHLLVTMRPLSSSWDPAHPERSFVPDKTNKAYPVRRGAEEIEVLAKDWATYKSQGWCKLYNWYSPKEAQYNPKTGRIDWRETDTQRLTMAEGQAAGLQRRSKQPISVRRTVSPWDSISMGGPKDALKAWRRQWEIRCNEALAAAGSAERVDCRSYRARHIHKTPTAHEGPRVQAVERKAREKGQVKGEYGAATKRHHDNVAVRAQRKNKALGPLFGPLRLVAFLAVRMSLTAKDVLLHMIRRAVVPHRQPLHQSWGRRTRTDHKAEAAELERDRRVRAAYGARTKAASGDKITRREADLLTPKEHEAYVKRRRGSEERRREGR